MGKNSHKSSWEYQKGNGRICLACLRRSSNTKFNDRRSRSFFEKEVEDKCSYCKSKSMMFIGWTIRLPRRSDTRSKWSKFVKRFLHWDKDKDLPNDFMENI